MRQQIYQKRDWTPAETREENMCREWSQTNIFHEVTKTENIIK